jgi:hypothetical protein
MKPIGTTILKMGIFSIVRQKEKMSMKKNNFTLFIFLLLGVVIGAIITQLLTPVHGISFLTKFAQFSWEPKADLQIIKYDLPMLFRINAIHILSMIGVLWIYRKM